MNIQHSYYLANISLTLYFCQFICVLNCIYNENFIFKDDCEILHLFSSVNCQIKFSQWKKLLDWKLKKKKKNDQSSKFLLEFENFVNSFLHFMRWKAEDLVKGKSTGPFFAVFCSCVGADIVGLMLCWLGHYLVEWAD